MLLSTSINIDIDPSCRPDIIASATHLPFRACAFDLVFFTEVIEHLPKGEEVRALKEIERVLKKYGKVIFSCPNNVRLFTFLDPAYWIIGHRHYTFDQIKKFFNEAKLKVLVIYTAGSIWTCLSNLWYCLFIYPFKKFC